jgi:hypothetical protein
VAGDLPLIETCDGRPPLPAAAGPAAVVFWTETRAEPRPLKIHCMRADLGDERIDLAALIGEDPDGDGPADSSLLKPESLARGSDVIAAVNANAFAGVPGTEEGREQRKWYEGRPVDVIGWALSGERQSSAPQRHYVDFWVSPDGRAHVGDLAEAVDACAAVAGFGPLIIGGEVRTREGGDIHPRTAAGTDVSGRYVWLVVVDGRQPGSSEGMTTHELARFLSELGCHDAVNLDGGGSSVMMLAATGSIPEVVSSPSDRTILGMRTTRPVPVMLAVRRVSRDE